jgi:hypothetical protein
MIASPGDVAAEQSAIQAIIHDWNSLHSEERRTVLMPVTWESHSTPEMGERAQAIINRQVLGGCDLLVAVFWTRIGSPTGSSQSGTVEEIRKHLDSEKPAMIYFSQKPVALDSVDSGQYEALTEFKQECMKAGLIATYDSLEEFYGKFSRHLAQVVRDRFPSAAGGDGEPSASSGMPPTMSNAAKRVLIAAADAGGEILRIPLLGGTLIQAGALRYSSDTSDRRELAQLEAAMRELTDADLIEPRGHKNETFAITHKGYQAADAFREEFPSQSDL